MPCRYLPSVSQPSKIGRGVISNQHALVGSMGFSRSLLQPEWHQHISVFGSLLPSPLVVKQPKSTRVPPRPHNSSQRAGEPLKTSQAILGHSDMQTTLQVYTHAVSESVLRAEERLAKAVLDSIGPKSRKAVSRKTE
jgi:hypothetical protein